MFNWRGSVAEWLACWTQAQRARVQIAVATLSGNSQASRVTPSSKIGSSPLKGCGVTAGLAESNGSLQSGL